MISPTFVVIYIIAIKFTPDPGHQCMAMSVVAGTSGSLLIKTTNERLQCAVCTYLLNGPLQFPCGHRICTPCARRLKQDKYVVATELLIIFSCSCVSDIHLFM